MTVRKDVFKCFLNVDEDCAEVTSEGKSFQTRGAATPKTRSPTVFSLERRTTSLWLDADRRRLRESSSTAHCKSLARYSGAVLLRQRNTRTARRNNTREWNSLTDGMMDAPYLSQSCKITGYSPRHVSLHGCVAVQKYSQIANRLCRLDSISADGKWITWDECCWRFEAHQSTSVLAACCKRLDAIHLSTSLMHTVTLFYRACMGAVRRAGPAIIHYCTFGQRIMHRMSETHAARGKQITTSRIEKW